MIISCGKRQLVSYTHGWKIEIKKVNQKTQKTYWVEDRPAYPASLAHALEIVCEREMIDAAGDGPVSLDVLSSMLKQASTRVRKYMELARSAA